MFGGAGIGAAAGAGARVGSCGLGVGAGTCLGGGGGGGVVSIVGARSGMVAGGIVVVGADELTVAWRCLYAVDADEAVKVM
jgi:hypothetical protein